MGAPSLDVVDWRRRTSELYARVRSAEEPAEAHALWIKGRNILLLEHPASPVPHALRGDYPGATVAPYDPAYRFVVPLVTNAPPQRRDVVTGTDGVVVFDLAGCVELPGLGSLDVWWLSGYGGGLFIPVKDATSGHDSYGGGRYVLDTVKGADLGGDANGLVIDLNFAYQPSCAYDEAWACPLPGPGNTLLEPVSVGELVARGRVR
ncbi:MAG: hypothetical protein CVT68_08220 [Actinobacteria bacterium HGW-Actinobacteria-8]|nr:MAG: hypothetical protein CVT68_08220 [Actinobacteria bacterium HGW-Actinobacteria-8]